MKEWHMKKWQKILIAIGIALGLALFVNWAILKLFEQRSSERAEHSFMGIILLMVYSYVVKDKIEAQFRPVQFFLLALIPCYGGTVFPDLDISLLGIGGHRNPLFHSSLSYLVFFFIRLPYHRFLSVLITGYGVGLASHLWWDVVDFGDVRWIPDSLYDRVWLGINGLLCLMPFDQMKERIARVFR